MINNIITFLFNCPMCGLSFPVVSKKLKAMFFYLREENARVLLWLVTEHGKATKKSGSFLVNHDLGDQLKIVLCLF